MSSLPVYESVARSPSASGQRGWIDGAHAGETSPAQKYANARQYHMRLAVRAFLACLVLTIVILAFMPETSSTAVRGAVSTVQGKVCPIAPTCGPAVASTTSVHQDLAALDGVSAYRTNEQKKRHSRIIKLTFAFGKGSIDPTGHGMEAVREQLIDGHIEHARRHGYKQFVQRVDMMGNIMTKPTTALQILLEELQKPEAERAEWIVQHDADMVVYNYNLSLETFLPPAERNDIHLLATRDGNGFNSGCMYMRVSPLMAELLGGNLMYMYMPGARQWNFAEQGMLGNLVMDVPRYNQSTVIVPKHWINAYPPGWEGGFTPGDWILHTVAWAKQKLPEFVKEGAKIDPKNNISPEESGLAKEVDEFWKTVPAPPPTA